MTPAEGPRAARFDSAAGHRLAMDAAAALVGGPLGPVLASTSRAIVDSVIYELERLPDGQVAAYFLGNTLQPPPAIPAEGTVPTTLDLLDAAADRLGGLPPAAADALATALARTQAYLGLSGAPLAAEVPVPVLRTPPRDTCVRPGWSPEVEAVATQELRWEGVWNYVESRVGPLAELVGALSSRDRIRFSNLPIGESLGDLPNAERAVRLDLPVSSWSKSIHLLAHDDGTRTLVLSDFPGKALMRHFELLMKKGLEKWPDAPAISTVESTSAYEATYAGLRALFDGKAAEMGPVDAVAVGYDHAFQERWAERWCGSATVPGGWSADVYEMPNCSRLAVLSTKGSYHGEILGESLRRLVDGHPEIRAVFTAGSAGSLHVRDPYEMVFPGRIVAGSGAVARNILAAPGERTVHESVLSPLSETPRMMHEAMARQVTTVDMETGHVAQSLAGTGVGVGAALLVTDFPVERSMSKRSSLDVQDAAAKYRSVDRYVDAVESFLTGGKPPLAHPLEAVTGKTLDALSKENLALQLRELGDLAPQEQILFDRIAGLTPDWSFRMTAARMGRALDDGAILSTAQVERLKGATVSPYTPAVEDRMFGAFEHLFGSVGFDDGDSTYGDCTLKIRPEAWQARSWATYRSGWQAIRSEVRDTGRPHPKGAPVDDDLLVGAQKRFASWVVMPEDFGAAMAAWALRQLRTQDPAVTAELLRASDAELPTVLRRHELVFLEGKIRGSLNWEDVREAVLPPGASPELRAKLEAREIPVAVR